MRRLVTYGGCILDEGWGLWLRNMTSIDDSFTMSTYDVEPLEGGTGSSIQAPDCFHIHSRVVLE
jgi:hypothetical protein